MNKKILYGILIILGLYALRNLWRDIRGDVVKEVVRYKVQDKIKTVYVQGKTVYVERTPVPVPTKDAVKIFPDIAEAIAAGQARVIGVDVPKSTTALGYTTNTSVYIAVKDKNNELILGEDGKPKFVFDIKRKMIRKLMVKPGLTYGMDFSTFALDGGIVLKFAQVYRLTLDTDVLIKSAGLGISYQIMPNLFMGGYLNTSYKGFLVDKHPNLMISMTF